MRMDFLINNDHEDFLMAEDNTMSGVMAPAHDRFEAGMRIVDLLADDLALDLKELDLEDFT